MRILLMHNPKAGDRKYGKKQLVGSLAKFGHQTVYQSTKQRGYKKALKQSVDLVLAAGGDGTVGKVARSLMNTGVPLGVLPLGTANNFARTLGFSAAPEQIIACLDHGSRREFDVGIAIGLPGKRYFLEAAGAVSWPITCAL